MTHDLEVNDTPVELVVNKAIERNVLASLGLPPGYKCTAVKSTTPKTVRVNVFVEQGDLFRTSRISDSFFLKVNENGDIVGGDPIFPKYKTKSTQTTNSVIDKSTIDQTQINQTTAASDSSLLQVN